MFTAISIKIILFEDTSSIIIKQKENIARPRFELGSKAPKASMLGHYIRRNFTSSTGLPGTFSYILLSLECYAGLVINEIIYTIKDMPRSILLSSSIVFV